MLENYPFWLKEEEKTPTINTIIKISFHFLQLYYLGRNAKPSHVFYYTNNSPYLLKSPLFGPSEVQYIAHFDIHMAYVFMIFIVQFMFKPFAKFFLYFRRFIVSNINLKYCNFVYYTEI